MGLLATATTVSTSPVAAQRLVRERFGDGNANFIEASANVFSAVIALVDSGYKIKSITWGSAAHRPRIVLTWEPALDSWTQTPVVTRIRCGRSYMVQSTVFRNVQIEWVKGVH